MTTEGTAGGVGGGRTLHDAQEMKCAHHIVIIHKIINQSLTSMSISLELDTSLSKQPSPESSKSSCTLTIKSTMFKRDLPAHACTRSRSNGKTGGEVSGERACGWVLGGLVTSL